MSDKYALNTNPAAWFRSKRPSCLIRFPHQSGSIPKESLGGNIFRVTSKPVEVDMVGSFLEVTVSGDGNKSPARFLPWEDNGCAFFKIDDSADIVWTTQLSGCNMYVYKTTGPGGGIWLFHSNSNASASDAAENNLAKRTLAGAARNHVTGTGDGLWDLSLERGVQPFYPAGAAAGIFFGQRTKSVNGGDDRWEFSLFDPVERLRYGVGMV
ncbi:MAG: hypothetical protein COA99_05335 [Moraxellaceae bacterium]|nr:MAG: hypothetical protein COA99_05335 [Moraxellaceae bacterium]